MTFSQKFAEIQEEIRLAAYFKYVERGRIDGFDQEDWLVAEKEQQYPAVVLEYPKTIRVGERIINGERFISVGSGGESHKWPKMPKNVDFPENVDFDDD